MLNGTCHINIFEVYNFLKVVIERIHAMKHNFIDLFIFPHLIMHSFD
jgi:hypothetical protein